MAVSIFLRGFLIILMVMLQACGGGGGGSTSTQGSSPSYTPLTADPVSFVNKGATDLSNFVVPKLSTITSDGYESVAATLAVADFQRTGQYSAFVVGTNGVSARAYFLKYDTTANRWSDVSGELFASDADRSACADPRQGLVTKFNSDGNPDVYLVCAGAGTTRVDQLMYISRVDGKYVRYASNFQANATSAAIADLNGDQLVDIVTTDGGSVFRVWGGAENLIGNPTWMATKQPIVVTITPMPAFVRNLFLIPRNGEYYLLVGGQGSGQNVVAWYQNSGGAFDTSKSRSFVIPSTTPAEDYFFDYVELDTYGYIYATSVSSANYLKLSRIEVPLANSGGPVASGDLYKYTGTPTYTTPPSWATRVVIKSGKLVPYDAGCANNPVNAADQRCTQNFLLDTSKFSL